MRHLLLLPVIAACGGRSSTASEPEERPDLAVALAPGQARAGWVTDPQALWGGIGAEGAVGDVKLYNDRVRFVVQAPDLGNNYVGQGGHVIDADVVRAPGQPGRDIVDEWLPMAGLGRLMDPTSVEVVDDGSESGVAVVRARGHESPMDLFEGVVEAWGELVPDLGIELEHTYRLPADSWLLEVTTTITATDAPVTVAPGDGFIAAAEAARWFGAGKGFSTFDGAPIPWSGFFGDRNEVAIGVFAGDTTPLGGGGVQALASLLDLGAAFGDPVTIDPGTPMTYRRYYGVGPDLATLSDAWQQTVGIPTTMVGSTVRAADGPVAGARVAVVVDGAPFTVAVTGADGSWHADVPVGSDVSWVVDGRGPGTWFSFPDGAPLYGPYAAAPARELALDTLSNGAAPIPLARGRGVSDPADPDTLGVPARLHVTVDDGGAFEVILRMQGEPGADTTLVAPRPSGRTAVGWGARGTLDLELEPGTYDATVHRGFRFERWLGEITVVAGEDAALDVALPQAVFAPGWMFGDPHSHSSPSPDGRVPMEHRLLEQAGVGVQLHFGTDHDTVVDYNALLGPLGLTDRLASVVSTEMSPAVRGHLNLYPLTPRGDLPNGGAWPWWRTPVATTTDEFAALRARHGGALAPNRGFALQVNHPKGVGMMDFAEWRPGEIGNPDYWGADFDAMEVMNPSHDGDYLDIYFDLVNRGFDITPTSVTDSHSLFGGDPGLHGTWFGMGTDDPAAYTPDALREVMIAHRTVAARGLFLEMSIDPGSTIVGTGALEVTAHGASWSTANRLRLYRDGVEIEVVEAPAALFLLEPDADASYVVVAEGDQTLAPVWDQTPWAASAAIKVDVAGDGWTPPLPPLVLGP